MSSTNNRASLLAGLRTGGVRSTSQPTVPQTAAVGGSFNVPRYSQFNGQCIQEDEADQLAELLNQNMQLGGGRRMMQQPLTASAVDGAVNRFQQQQQASFLRQMTAQRAAQNAMAHGGVDSTLQVQELLKLQAMQAQAAFQQQLQVEMMAQVQLQQQILQHQQQQQLQQQLSRAARRVSGFGEPATAGPLNTSFDLRSRSGPADIYDEGQVPMTAALGGKFGSRSLQSGLNPNANVFTLRGEAADEPEQPKTASGRTTVISGGATLGSSVAPSKSDSALSWRRQTIPTSTNGSPNPRIAPAPLDEASGTGAKIRPQPLRFSGGLGGALTVAIEANEENDDSDGSFTSDSVKVGNGLANTEDDSSPSTPPSAGSNNSLPSREEATKKLYEGLGIGRPVATNVVQYTQIPSKQLGGPIRQPKGPPASVDELGSRNFATRTLGPTAAEVLVVV